MCGLKISTVCICHNEQLYPDPRILMDCCQLRFREWDIEMMTGICERVEIWNGFFRRDQWYMGVCIVLGDVYQGIADLSSLPSFCQKLHWRCCLLWAVAPWKMTIVGVCDSEWPLLLVDLLSPFAHSILQSFTSSQSQAPSSLCLCTTRSCAILMKHLLMRKCNRKSSLLQNRWPHLEIILKPKGAGLQK